MQSSCNMLWNLRKRIVPRESCFQKMSEPIVDDILKKFTYYGEKAGGAVGTRNYRIGIGDEDDKSIFLI